MPESPRRLSIRMVSSRIGPFVAAAALAAACADPSLTTGSDAIEAAAGAGGDTASGSAEGAGDGGDVAGTNEDDGGMAAGGGAGATGTGDDADGSSGGGSGDDVTGAATTDESAQGSGDNSNGSGADGGEGAEGNEGGDGADGGASDDDAGAGATTTLPADGGSGGDGSGGPAPSAPDWLGTRVLPTTPDGAVPPQTTPEELIDRRFATVDTLPPPAGGAFTSSIGPLAGDPLSRSTWSEVCPVGVDDLRYVTVSFWGFDDRSHQGELIVHRTVADDIVTVFEALYAARYPIEEMRIVTQADLDAPPTGDGNNTSTFACRAVTGGSRFSEHAYGLAIDINPFQNPYVKGDVVLPELATIYGERGTGRPGMISEGDPAVQAFDAIGWGWGGRWRSLKDYQHFALNDR